MVLFFVLTNFGFLADLFCPFWIKYFCFHLKILLLLFLILFTELRRIQVHMIIQLGWRELRYARKLMGKMFQFSIFLLVSTSGKKEGALLAVKLPQQLGMETVFDDVLETLIWGWIVQGYYVIVVRCRQLHCTKTQKIFSRSIGCQVHLSVDP